MFKDDLDQSIDDFQIFGVPATKAFFGIDAQIVPTETSTQDDALKKMLDFAGIDYLVKCARGLYPVAARMQHGKCYAATSIRRSRPNESMTEYEKITRARQYGTLAAQYHIHGFVADDEKSALVAVSWTDEVLSVIKLNPSRWRTNWTDGVTFFFAPWTECKNLRVDRVTVDGNVEDVTAKINASAA